ncbi:MFS transporter [Candidatus Acetothermia bacterium]|nr:MFS transporter [Candidatus Acetothermia bacterium]MBI3642540.1 MFS transporter [Candidatus Acetothermia bacterium]
MNARKRWTTAGLVSISGLMLAHFTNDFYSNFVPVFIPKLQEKFALSHALIGLLAATYSATGSFFQLFFGYISDRVSHWRFVLFGPLITGFFISFVGVAPSYEAVLGVLVLASLGTAMFHPQGSATSGRLFKGNRGFIVSLFIASGSLGFALGPLLMAIFVNAHGLEQSPLAILPLTILGVLMWLLQRDLKLGAHAAQPSSPTTPKPSTGRLKENALPIAILWGLVVFRHSILLSFQSFFLILMGQRGMDYVTGSLALFAVLMAGFVGGIVGGYASDRWGRWRIATFSLWLGFLATLGFLVISGPLSFISLLIGMSALNASNPSIVAFAQEMVPGQSSTASAIVMGVGWGMGGLLVSVVGLLADLLQNLESALFIATLTALLVSVLLTYAGNQVFEKIRIASLE